MCKCGCNSCETDSTALVLKESKFVHTPVSDGLKYHIDNKIPLNENIYRIGSKEYMKLYEEARSLYSRNKLDVSKDDKYFLTETHVGNFGTFEGKKVPLDIPMLNEVEVGDVVKIDKAYGGGKGEVKDKKGSFIVVNGSSYHESDVKLIKESSDYDEIANDEFGMDYEQLGSNEKEWVQDQFHYQIYESLLDEKLKGIDGKACWKGYKLSGTKKKDGKTVDNCVPMEEAEFKGKEVALGKPKRGGPKAYYVYVKDGDKVKKVTFGSGGLRAKIKNKDARSAFAARHNCDKKKDRTTAGYWSCNLPKYAKQLGLGANMNTYW